MRRLALALFLLVCARPSAAGDAEFEQLLADSGRGKTLAEGIKILKVYFKKAAEVDGGKSKSIPARDKAISHFRKWLDNTGKTMGMDLRGKPNIVVEVFDRARVDIVAKTRAGRGKIEYIKVANPRGLERLEYAVLLPKTYKPKNHDRYPLVVSLHERVINAKHPAFRGKPLAERARAAVYNGWLKTPAAESVVVIAPTGTPNGFRFNERGHSDDLHTMFVTMGQGLTDFRTDWNRVFLEVHGSALRVICEQPFIFAGCILRDRESEKRLAIPKEEFFMFENLNGMPLLYVADNKTWDRVGKPLSDALTAAYKKAGKPENLILIKDDRDANGALKGDPQRIAEFLAKHRLPKVRSSFTWRYFTSNMRAPLPVQIGNANYLESYDPDAPLSAKAGSVKFDVKLEKDAKSEFVNIVTIEITEAENLLLYLYDGFVNLSFPVTVVVNGQTIHDKVKVERNWNVFVNEVLPRRFFMLPIVGSLECAFKLKPQFEKKAKKAPGGAKAAGANDDPKGAKDGK